jgi:hypothetical protein
LQAGRLHYIPDFGEPYRFELPMPGSKGFLRVRALGPK